MSKPLRMMTVPAVVVLCCVLLSLWNAPPALGVGDVSYTVGEDDTPSAIARKLKIPLLDFLSQVGGILTAGQEIVVCPPGDRDAQFPSQYLEFYTVRRDQTLLQVAQWLKTGVEELADFNALPRRCHLVQAGETIADLSRRYQASLQPLADVYQTTPGALIQSWNELDETAQLPEGRLLTIGWQEPREGDRLAYPLVEKIIASVEEDMKKEGLLTPKGAQFFNAKIQYQLYAVKEGDTLKTLAEESGKKVSVRDLLQINNLEEGDTLTVGQVLFVPTAESAFGGSSARVYRAYPTPGAVLRSVPSTDSRVGRRDVPLKDEDGKRQEIYVYEKPYTYNPAWRAVMVDSSKMPWAWMRQEHLEFEPPEKRLLYYAIGRANPPNPEPPRPQVVARPFYPVVIPVSGVCDDVKSPTKRRALEWAYWFARNRVPYKLGGFSQRQIDCSGLVYYCFRQARVAGWQSLQPSCRNQIKRGQHVGDTANPLRPGDRLYFDTARLGYGITGTDHTGLYIGGGYMIEATPPRCKKTNLRHYLKVCWARRDPD